MATLRPTDGLFSLSIYGAQRIVGEAAQCVVIVDNDVAEYIVKGNDVFSRHVMEADEAIRARDEVIIADGDHRVLAVGRAILSSVEMKHFKKGVAVKVRHGSMRDG